jgi:hypothetical protein
MRVPLELFAHMHGHTERKRQMRRVRAYSRDERKRLIIHVLAEAIRVGDIDAMTCAEIAKKMDIVPSTKLRKILAEMTKAEILSVVKQPDAGIAGYRFVYSLNAGRDAYWYKQANKSAVERARQIRLNTAHGVEILVLS